MGLRGSKWAKRYLKTPIGAFLCVKNLRFAIVRWGMIIAPPPPTLNRVNQKSEIRNRLEDENCFEVDAATKLLEAGMFESELGKSSREKTGNSLVFYQRGGTPPPL